ncbi:MAG: RidA family protein [candidate division KSB1 bacterium]|nr:RidA family protein [candidate division KSB1 bacterium]
MQIIQTDKAPQAIGPYSQALRISAKDFIYTSGQLGLNPDTGELVSSSSADQCRQALKNIQAVLDDAGLTLFDVVKITVFLVDIADFQTVNDIFIQMFGEHKPARSVVQVAALPKNGRIEIEAIAAVRS